MCTVLTLLSLSQDWPIHQLDFKNAFLHDTLTKTIYCSQPTNFIDPAHPHLVCRLNKSLYVLKHTLQAWYCHFVSYLVSLGFVEAKTDNLMFGYRRDTDPWYLLLYINNIVLTASRLELLQHTTTATTLQLEFDMKELGPLHHFLVVSMKQ
jgi:hypothetical protein